MIYIKGIIGNEKGETNLMQIVSQTSKLSGDIEIEIDSQGGDLYVAMDIYNYLIGLPNRIITSCTGMCASAASVIFLAGDVRIAGCPIMIHNPFLDGVQGDSNLLRQASEMMAKVEKELVSTYAARTGLCSDVIASFMKDETYISPSEAFEIGFATEAKVIAYARVNKPINNNKNKKRMRKIFNYFSKTPVYSMVLKTADGTELDIDREDGEPKIGDKANIDGSHTMEDGTVIIVEDHTIIDIISPENEESYDDNERDRRIEGEVDELRREVDELKRRLDELTRREDAPQSNGYRPKNRVSTGSRARFNPLDEKKEKLQNRK